MDSYKTAGAIGLKKFARRLLTTTCLTAAAVGAAHAGTINESIVGDFSNTFAGAGLTNSLLPNGTNVVNGGLNPSGDLDFFTFQGLSAGTSFTLAGTYENGQFVTLYNSAQTALTVQASNPPTLTGIVPGDGMLVVGVTNQEQVTGYSFTLTATPAATPEPSTIVGGGLGLAALALRRKRKK